MEELIQHFELPTYYQTLLDQMREALLHPQLTLSGQLLPHIQQDSLTAFGLEKAEEYHRYAWTAPMPSKATKIWNCPPRCYSLMLFKGAKCRNFR